MSADSATISPSGDALKGSFAKLLGHKDGALAPSEGAFLAQMREDYVADELPGMSLEDLAANFADFWRNSHWDFQTIRLVGVAMVGSLFSSDAWNNITFATRSNV